MPSTRGASANATAATNREGPVPIPSASADPQQAPAADGHQQGPPQPLDRPARNAEFVADQKERAVRKEIAVGLILSLPERQVTVPERRRPGEEAQRVGGQVEFGVRGDHPGTLCEAQHEGDGEDPGQPATGQRPGRLPFDDPGSERASRGCRTQRG